MSLDRYRDAWRAPGVARLLASSLVARLPNGMSSLAVLLLVSGPHGYGRAGLVTGLYVAAAGVSTPLFSRAADRFGPRQVLVPTACAYAAAMLALAVVPRSDYTLELAVAVAAGFATPPVVSVVRGLWPRLVGADAAQAVYGLEATAQELVFIAGPAIVALLAGLADPRWAVAATGLLALAGTLVCAAMPELRDPAGHAERTPTLALLRSRLAAYLLVAVGLTVALNMTDVGVVAFASGHRASPAAGVLLAVWSVGSMAGGLLFGTRAGAGDDRAVGVAVLAVAAGIALAAAAPGRVGLGVVLFVGGAAVAPALARLYARVGSWAPPGTSTEAFGWIAVGLLAGSAVGAALGGGTVDVLGPRVTFLLAAVPPALCAVVLL